MCYSYFAILHQIVENEIWEMVLRPWTWKYQVDLATSDRRRSVERNNERHQQLLNVHMYMYMCPLPNGFTVQL
jgi:hypothetical protein